MERVLSVLLVDDEESILHSLARRLQREGFVVEACDNGMDAVAAVRARRGMFNVAIIDQVMPLPGGLETMHLLHQDFPLIPVIILTARGDLGAAQDAMAAGAFRYVSKSDDLDISQLALVVREAERARRDARLLQVLRIVSDITMSVEQEDDPDICANRVVGAIHSLGYDRARLYLINDERTHLCGVAEVGGVNTPISQIRLPLISDEYSKRLLRERRVLISHKGDFTDDFADPCAKADVMEWIEIPLIFHGNIIGKITTDNKYSQRPLTRDDQDDLMLFANPAAAVIARQLRREQHERALDSLLLAGQQINGARTLDELYHIVWQRAQELFPKVENFRIALYDSLNGILEKPFWIVRGQERQQDATPRRRGISEYVLDRQKPLLLPNGDAVFRVENYLDPLPDGLEPSASAAVAPMFLGERVCGTITVGTYHADVTYTPEHLAILQSFANQTAAAIQHVGRLEQAERLRASAVVLSGQHTTAGVIKAIVEQGHYLIGSDITDLVIHEPDGSLRKAQMVAPQDKSDVFTEPRQQGGLTRYVVDQKKTVVIPDTSEHALIKDLVTKAGIRSVLAMPLMHDDRVLAVLFAHTYKQRFFDEYDLSLWTAFASQAAIALWNALDEEIEGERLNRQLRALVRILQASRKGSSAQDILDQVAVSVQDALGMDICSVLEYDSKERAFCRRGAVGLRYPKHEPTLSVSFRTMFLDPMQRTEIPDVRADLRMRNRSFTHREEIASVFIFPLHVEQEPLGLLFANYRHPKKLTAEELDAISIFADMAALVIRESRLRNELVQIRERLDMRVILTRMSIMEDAWRHSVTTKAATIRIQAMLLKKGIERSSMPKQAVDIALRPLVAIDALAAEIARTQPRLPQSWELEPELVPLATLLEDTYKRQSSAIEQEFGGRIEVRADFEGLDGLQVRASRRWLIFALESVFDNAKKAMPEGGVIRFSARRSGRRVEVRVSDTGKGMSAELRGKLFKEVIPKSGLDEGQGIGSMLTAIIVRELGGTIELEPAAVGTTVLMRLPVTVVE